MAEQKNIFAIMKYYEYKIYADGSDSDTFKLSVISKSTIFSIFDIC